jgi:hypothetical protein
MVTSDQSRGFLLEGMCSGVAPHLSDGSSAIGTIVPKVKSLLGWSLQMSTGPLEDPLLNNQPSKVDDNNNDWGGVYDRLYFILASGERCETGKLGIKYVLALRSTNARAH